MSDRPKIELKMLQPLLKTLPPMLRPPPRKRASKTGRDADPRRTLALNTAAWQKLRASVLRDSPLCDSCKRRGLIVMATDVDHISGDPSDNGRANLASLCHSCHSLKTAADHGKNVYLGCDVNGMPLDPRHPWNNGA